METKRWNEDDSMEEAAALLAAGEVVALPTETVYGLGADARSEAAVQKIFLAKGRPSDNPLIVHVENKEQMYALVVDVPAFVEDLMEQFSPGPITYVLKSSGVVAPSVTAGLTTVGIRLPDHPVAQKLLHACQFPIAAPSANVSGKPSPTEVRHVLDDMQGKIAGVIDGGHAQSGLESTVVDCTGPVPVILRPGEITAEQIASVVGQVEVANPNETHKPKSPGMKYKHYAPDVPLYVYIGYDLETIATKYSKQQKRTGILTYGDNVFLKKELPTYYVGENKEAVAHQFYRVLRRVTSDEVDELICVVEDVDELSDAIMDRLTRAATQVFIQTKANN